MLPSAHKIPHGPAFHVLSTSAAQANIPYHSIVCISILILLPLLSMGGSSNTFLSLSSWKKQKQTNNKQTNHLLCLVGSGPLLGTGNKDTPLSKPEKARSL